jgi:hypothetical protein
VFLEQRQIRIIQRQPEHGLENHEPGRPGLFVLEPGPKDSRIVARIEDGERGLGLHLLCGAPRRSFDFGLHAEASSEALP